MIVVNSRMESILSRFVTVRSHETSSLMHSALSFFFILSAYFVVLPLRDEGAISLGLENLPGLFVGSLLLTLVAAPVSTLIFASPNLSKRKALAVVHRIFSFSLVIFFILWFSSKPGNLQPGVKATLPVNSNIKVELKVSIDHTKLANTSSLKIHGYYYISVRIALFLWIALLNLVTVSSTWARVTDVMDSESGSRLFGFIGAGATLGQLCGSLFAAGMAWLGPYLLLVAALLLEFAARSSQGIKRETPRRHTEELSPLRQAEETEELTESKAAASPSASNSTGQPQFGALLDGLRLILSSSYLLQVALFLWLSAVVSSFFYFQKVTVIASSVSSPVDRRRLFAQINSLIAVFILVGQLTITGRILTFAGVTAAICSAPSIAFVNQIALAVRPTWIAVAVCETLRKVM
ncbi:hypothetical protein M569_04415, partial [Genlisea aurea]